MAAMPSKSFLQGVGQFNQRQFYECHDTLEAIWIEAPESDKKFYQGVLQIAVACHHLSNLNWRGAVILLGEGINRLSGYQPSYHDLDVEKLLDESTTLLRELQQISPENLTEFVRQLFLNLDSKSKETEDPLSIESKLPFLVLLSSTENTI